MSDQLHAPGMAREEVAILKINKCPSQAESGHVPSQFSEP